MRNEYICNFKSLYVQTLWQSDGSRYETEIAENGLSTMNILIFIATKMCVDPLIVASPHLSSIVFTNMIGKSFLGTWLRVVHPSNF